MTEREIITRRNLPHWYVPGAMHFVTYRLVGTIPVEILHNLREKRDALLKRRPPGLTPAQGQERAHKQFFAGYDHYLDQQRAITWLAQPRVAAMTRSNLYHHEGSKYHLLAYCVMPNHVHVLLQPIAADLAEAGPSLQAAFATGGDELEDSRSPLSSIMHSLKSYTAHQANAILGRSGAFWQHESYDHWVRDEDELERIVAYIVANPVKAGLVKEPHQWFFCSAHDRFVQDGEPCGWLACPLATVPPAASARLPS
jgi:putative DNA methylase